MKTGNVSTAHLFGRKHHLVLDLGITILILLIVTGIGSLFYRLGLDSGTILLLYLLGVMILAVITTSGLCSTLFSIAGVLAYNYLFTVPNFTFHAYNKNHIATFLILFIASSLASMLAIQIKKHADAFSKDAYSAQVLYNASQQFSKAKDANQVFSCAAIQLHKLMSAGIVIYPVENETLCSQITYGNVSQTMMEKEELYIRDKVVQKGPYAGILPSSHGFYAPIHLDDVLYGVVGVEKRLENLDGLEQNMLLSILGVCAISLENVKIQKEKEETAILAENERLRSNLLRMISHDLRTPLTSIYGNASNLLYHEDLLDPKKRKAMYADIYDDSSWLIDLVENLLSITRLEEGRLDMHISDDVVEDAIEEALRRVGRHATDHSIEYTSQQGITVAKMDARLIVQVVVNLVNNALKYTPKGTPIQIHVEPVGTKVKISVCDQGPGVPDEKKEKIFDMFYTGSNQIADSRRSLGLGLALCQSIVQAHQGELWVEDHQPQGAVFAFTLPAGGSYE